MRQVEKKEAKYRSDVESMYILHLDLFVQEHALKHKSFARVDIVRGKVASKFVALKRSNLRLVYTY